MNFNKLTMGGFVVGACLCAPFLSRFSSSDVNAGFAVAEELGALTHSQNGKGELDEKMAIPVETVPPRYPSKAYKRGIEGWVVLSFDVDVEGRPQNLVVADSNPPGYFEEEALKAVEKWRFETKTVNGVPTEQKNKEYQITFQRGD